MPTTGPVARVNGQLLEDWKHTDGRAWTRLADSYDDVEGVTKMALLVWDTVGLTWVKMTQPGSSGGGGGGAVTVADGADVTQGAKADAAWDGVAASPTTVAINKATWTKLEAVRALLAGTLTIAGAVTVSNFPASQAVTGPLTDAQLRATAVPVDVSDRDVRLAGRVKHLDSTGAVIDPAIKSQLPAALVGGRLDVNLGASPATVPTSSAAATQADGHSASIGATTDLAAANTVIGRLKALIALLPAALVGGRLDANIGAWLGSAAPTVGQKAMASSVPVALASDQSVLPAVSEMRSATLWVTGTAAVNTGVTLTLPAAGAGLFHHITAIEVVKLYSVVGVAAGTGVIITTTNLPGNPSFTTEQLASAAGTAPKVVDFKPCTPIKSSVANTATTIVCPVQLQTIWRVNVTYFTAA